MNKHSLDLFLEACGASGPLQLSIGSSPQHEIGRRLLPQPFLVIGRHPRADLALDHEQISQRHAYLQVLDGRVFCMDLGSRTGISWESGPKRAGWLEHHQALQIGPFFLRIAHNTAAPEEQRPGDSGPALARPPLPSFRLDFQGDAVKQASSWRMSQALSLIGKAEVCKVRLLAPGVARLHASLIRTRHGVWVVDLLGQEGLAVNGAAVRFALLEDGDQLEIGNFVIRVCYDALPAASLPASDVSESRITVAAPPTARVALPAERDTPAAGEPAPPGPALLPRGGQAPPQTELVEALLVPLAQQFQLMQQQMFDQFQQTILHGCPATLLHLSGPGHVPASRRDSPSVKAITKGKELAQAANQETGWELNGCASAARWSSSWTSASVVCAKSSYQSPTA